jgi:hypothetical protein
MVNLEATFVLSKTLCKEGKSCCLRVGGGEPHSNLIPFPHGRKLIDLAAWFMYELHLKYHLTCNMLTSW